MEEEEYQQVDPQPLSDSHGKEVLTATDNPGGPELPFGQQDKVLWEEEDRCRELQRLVDGKQPRYNPRYRRLPPKFASGDYVM